MCLCLMMVPTYLILHSLSLSLLYENFNYRNQVPVQNITHFFDSFLENLDTSKELMHFEHVGPTLHKEIRITPLDTIARTLKTK